ncbi:hypothetical protein LPW11_17735 [Geomonas sp. RF6]|uniref:hypothetical protein n=1 Tax=Geomonas sp. RF6 TaxID=2897342 RepID=UPI001E634A72|nr:hypothetical protein [Geomonas sp. RF6]UFS69724.1 hypothetical protein LPW11_17735 [Geomonas sp. RF6]
MHRTFCTLFDHNYLYKGLALYHSLRAFTPTFTLWVLALSDEAYELLERMSLENVRLVRLEDLEDEELRRAKRNRSAVEYYWTLSPSLPLYVLKEDAGIDAVTYIDADCFFFSDPEPLYREMGDASVLVIEHRYSEERKAWEKTSGRFNVQFLVFKRDEIGMSVLTKWRSQCNEWCYYREEEGRFGDQMYLDAWPREFPGIHILQHKGGGLAPWNIKNYRLQKCGARVLVDADPLVFYHFHALRIYSRRAFEPAVGYTFTGNELALVYKPYQDALKRAMSQVALYDPSFAHGFTGRDGLARRVLAASVARLAAAVRRVKG